jgi:hypothetical protein
MRINNEEKVRYRLLYAVFFCFLLTSCAAVTKTEKLDANARPIKDIQIILVLGDLPHNSAVTFTDRSFYNHQLKSALASRFLQIFQANEVTVESIIFEDDTKQDHVNVQNLIRNAQVSHVLILSVEKHLYSGRYGRKEDLLGVGFVANLVDAQERRTVWKAHPFLYLEEKQPLLRSQHLAAQILNGMNTDGLIHLTQGYAIDLTGDRICNFTNSKKDR